MQNILKTLKEIEVQVANHDEDGYIDYEQVDEIFRKELNVACSEEIAMDFDKLVQLFMRRIANEVAGIYCYYEGRDCGAFNYDMRRVRNSIEQAIVNRVNCSMYEAADAYLDKLVCEIKDIYMIKIGY